MTSTLVASPSPCLNRKDRSWLALRRGLHLRVLGELLFRFALDSGLEPLVARLQRAEAHVVDADRFRRDGGLRGDGASEHAGLLSRPDRQTCQPRSKTR